MPAKTVTVDLLNERSKGRLPGLIGLEVVSTSPGKLTSRLKVRDELLAPNGYLHAASVVALADTSCGYGSVANLPPGATGFTTIELKSNFLGTARSGTITCVATMAHGGKGTQVWDAVVTSDDSKKVICLFRCTQMILYPVVAKRK